MRKRYVLVLAHRRTPVTQAGSSTAIGPSTSAGPWPLGDALLRPSYQPSPDSVYPALAALVGEGMLADENDGGPGQRRRTYRITRRGRAGLAHRRPTLRAFEVRTGVRLGTDLVRDILDRFVTRVEGIAERVDPDDLATVLDRAATELEAKRLHQRPHRRTSRGR